MTVTETEVLSDAERRLLLAEVHETLRQECREALRQATALGAEGSLAELDGHILELVPIVRRSTATRVEPYLAQILDDICAKCPHQDHSEFCALRYCGNCLLYRCAGPIVAAVRRALREIDIGRGLSGPRE
jgi:hypothetical protein